MARVLHEQHASCAGPNGLTNFVTLAGYDLTRPNVKLGLFVITLLALGGVYGLCHWITNSRLGRVLIAIRDNETRLRFSGYKPHHFKVFAFALAAMIAGLGGVLYAPQAGIFTPEYMTTNASPLIVAWVAVGGRGRLKGAVVGTLLVNLIYNYLTTCAPEFWMFVLGGLYIGAAVFFHTGMINFRGALFLAWLLAAPPIWKFVSPDKALSSLASAACYYGHWTLWVLLGAYLLWLLVDEQRINRPLKALGQRLLDWTEPLAPLVRKPAAFLAGRMGANVSSVQKAASEREQAARDESESSAASASELQHRLSRIARMTRVKPTAAPEGSLLKVNNVTVRFDGFKALDIESFELDPFELRVIIGPNGAGKTTLCDVISGKTRPAEGKVTFANTNITGMSDVEIARRGVGRKFQTPTVFNSLTVYENMELALPGRQALYRCFVSSATAARERTHLFDPSPGPPGRAREYGGAIFESRPAAMAGNQHVDSGLADAASGRRAGRRPDGRRDRVDRRIAAGTARRTQHHRHRARYGICPPLGSRVTVLNEGQVMADGPLEQVQKDPQVIEAYLGR